MTREEAKNLIVEIVKAVQGCKATELPVHAATLHPEFVQDGERFRQIPELIDELIDEEKLVEVAYSLPDMKYRSKSFLLPAGTEITNAYSTVGEF